VEGQLQEWTCVGVAMPTKQSLKKSTSKRSPELGTPRSTTCVHMKKDLLVTAHLLHGNKLSDMDMGGMNHMN
jgi:hypothetical protein